MKRVLILAEGSTEERFVKDVLAPYFWPQNLLLEPTILVTKRIISGPNFKGGVSTFSKFEGDVRRLLEKPGGALITTLVDYYGLPSDFPGMSTRPESVKPIQRVQHVEEAVLAYFKFRPDFVPFFALHEFEALLFSEPEAIANALNQQVEIAALTAIRSQFASPEEINDSPLTAPSKRIKAVLPAYSKVLHGPMVAGRIGVDKIRKECLHFNTWLQRLETF